MRFKFLFVITCLIFLMGCTPATPISNTPSVTPSRTPESTFTITPFQFFTLTPRPIKSSTPTFDASHLSTYTPALPTECPKQTTNVIPVFKSDPNKFCSDTETQILDFLNSGGKIESVVTAMKGSASQIDLTNDGVPELTVAECSFRIYSCKEGQYIKVLDMGDKEGYSHIIDARDMNLNGIPELIIGGGSFPFSNDDTIDYRILEWDKNQGFRNLSEQPDFSSRLDSSGVRNNWIYSDGIGREVQSIFWGNLSLVDIDGNGTIEFVLNSGLPTSFDGQAHGPWRAETSVFMWNGKNFLPYSIEAEPPQFRFQAVQDADYALFDEDYKKALYLYNDVIFNKNLEWWSTDRYLHESQVTQAEHSGLPVPSPLPPNFSEYKYLSAYARYRILTIYANLGQLSEAQMMYETIQNEYSDGQEGLVIAELATVFWNEYIISNNLHKACSNAISFATTNAFEIFNYVGFVKTEKQYDWTYHGWQKEHDYKIDDICPFK